MDQWETVMKATNDAFKNQCYYTALELGQKALKLAAYKFEHHCNCDSDKQIAAVMVSHFNLADTYIALDQFNDAVNEFETARSYIEMLVQHDVCDDVKKTAALRAGSYLQQEWNMFVQKHKTQLSIKPPIFETAALQLH